MTAAQKEEAAKQQNAQAADIQSEAEGLCPALTVLDELNVALACGMVTRENAERLIDAALAQADRQDMAGRLRQQLERKMRTTRHTTQYELKTKLIRYGLSLGYDYETVVEAASGLVTDTETCDEF